MSSDWKKDFEGIIKKLKSADNLEKKKLRLLIFEEFFPSLTNNVIQKNRNTIFTIITLVCPPSYNLNLSLSVNIEKDPNSSFLKCLIILLCTPLKLVSIKELNLMLSILFTYLFNFKRSVKKVKKEKNENEIDIEEMEMDEEIHENEEENNIDEDEIVLELNENEKKSGINYRLPEIRELVKFGRLNDVNELNEFEFVYVPQLIAILGYLTQFFSLPNMDENLAQRLNLTSIRIFNDGNPINLSNEFYPDELNKMRKWEIVTGIRTNSYRCLQTLLRQISRRCLFQHLFILLPSSDKVSNVVQTFLFDKLTIVVKYCAVMIRWIYHDSKAIMALAMDEQDERYSTTDRNISFTPFFSRLAQLLRYNHQLILNGIIFPKKNYVSLINCLLSTEICLIQVTPFERLSSGLITEIVQAIAPLLQFKQYSNLVCSLFISLLMRTHYIAETALVFAQPVHKLVEGKWKFNCSLNSSRYSSTVVSATSSPCLAIANNSLNLNSENWFVNYLMDELKRLEGLGREMTKDDKKRTTQLFRLISITPTGLDNHMDKICEHIYNFMKMDYWSEHRSFVLGCLTKLTKRFANTHHQILNLWKSILFPDNLIHQFVVEGENNNRLLSAVLSALNSIRENMFEKFERKYQILIITFLLSKGKTVNGMRTLGVFALFKTLQETPSFFLDVADNIIDIFFPDWQFTTKRQRIHQNMIIDKSQITSHLSMVSAWTLANISEALHSFMARREILNESDKVFVEELNNSYLEILVHAATICTGQTKLCNTRMSGARSLRFLLTLNHIRVRNFHSHFMNANIALQYGILAGNLIDKEKIEKIRFETIEDFLEFNVDSLLLNETNKKLTNAQARWNSIISLGNLVTYYFQNRNLLPDSLKSHANNSKLVLTLSLLNEVSGKHQKIKRYTINSLIEICKVEIESINSVTSSSVSMDDRTNGNYILLSTILLSFVQLWEERRAKMKMEKNLDEISNMKQFSEEEKQFAFTSQRMLSFNENEMITDLSIMSIDLDDCNDDIFSSMIDLLLLVMKLLEESPRELFKWTPQIMNNHNKLYCLMKNIWRSVKEEKQLFSKFFQFD
ncbi:hypothetical protein SNEBB_002636 [Seison nebaliae]|nr:hypothetical protein SNEBB_002636 [Seison nebaliae]